MLYVRYVFESSPLNTVSERTVTRESATQQLVGGAGSRVSENERYEWERTEMGNQVGSFMLGSRLFELICLRTTHH